MLKFASSYTLQRENILQNSHIQKLVAARRPGYALERAFYVDEEIFQYEVDHIYMRAWLYAGHVSEIPDKGDYFLFDFAGESVIIVRSESQQVSALLNVCRHRGSRVCTQQSGKSSKLSCPYHGWTYALNGELRGAAHMHENFDKNENGLRPVHMQLFEGMIYINFAKNPASFGAVKNDLTEVLQAYDLGNAKVAHRQKYLIDANWKLSVENYTECYHCAPAHPEYSRGHGLALGKEKIQEDMEVLMANASICGLSDKYIDQAFCKSGEFGVDRAYTRYPLIRGHVTGSEDGSPLAPLLGSIKGYDGGCTDFQVGPVSFALAYCDHVVLYRFTPHSASTSECDISWLVRADAEEGKDYDKDKLIWLWDVTTQADKFIIEHNQHGVNSRFYTPGPYSKMEAFTERFIDWYLQSIAVA